MTHRYTVTTYDAETGDYTPQPGLSAPSENITLWQVRAVLRELREWGYPCDYYGNSRDGHNGDPAVLVKRVDVDDECRELWREVEHDRIIPVLHRPVDSEPMQLQRSLF